MIYFPRTPNLQSSFPRPRPSIVPRAIFQTLVKSSVWNECFQSWPKNDSTIFPIHEVCVFASSVHHTQQFAFPVPAENTRTFSWPQLQCCDVTLQHERLENIRTSQTWSTLNTRGKTFARITRLTPLPANQQWAGINCPLLINLNLHSCCTNREWKCERNNYARETFARLIPQPCYKLISVEPD